MKYKKFYIMDDYHTNLYFEKETDTDLAIDNVANKIFKYENPVEYYLKKENKLDLKVYNNIIKNIKLSLRVIPEKEAVNM